MGPSSNRLQIDAIWGKTSTLPLGKKTEVLLLIGLPNHAAMVVQPGQGFCAAL